MMKAAQAPGVGGGLPLGAPNQGGHSPSQHQNMHQGKCLLLFRVTSTHTYMKQSGTGVGTVVVVAAWWIHSLSSCHRTNRPAAQGRDDNALPATLERLSGVIPFVSLLFNIFIASRGSGGGGISSRNASYAAVRPETVNIDGLLSEIEIN